MKKNKTVLLTGTFAIIFLISLFGIIKTLAAPDSFVITDAKLIEKSEGVTGEIESFNNGEIKNNIVFNKIDDYALYEVKIKNNTSNEYTIKSITDDNNNEYISYEYNDYKNTKISKNGDFNFQIKAIYKNKILDLSKREQNYNVKFTITYFDENGNEQSTNINVNNPKTFDNILVFVILLIVSSVGLVMLWNKKAKKNIKKMMIALIGLIFIPITVSASTILLNFSFVNNYKLHDKLLVTIIVDEEEQKQYIDYNTKLDSLDSPNVEGFIFNAWKLNDGSPFDINKPITDDIVIVADLTAINYNITYNLDGGTATNKTTYTVKDEFNLKNPTKDGYTFDGWTGTGITEMTKTVSIAKGSTGDRSYEAHFTANNYVIKYDSNDGTGTMENQSMVYGTSAVLRANIFEKTGFEFGGWNTKSDGTGKDYYDEEEVNNLTTSDQIVLYAQWVKPASLDTGSVLNAKMKNLANDSDEYTPGYDEFTIEHIARGKKLPEGYTPTEEKTISTNDSETPVYIWWDDDTKTIYWYSKAQTLFLNSDSGHMFEEMECLKDVSILYEVDSSKITSLERMFAYTWDATYAGIENLDISHVTNMDYTFAGTNFSEPELISNWNTGKVTTMEGTFSSCNFTSTSSLSGWDTSKVENMHYTFTYCYNLSDLSGLASWNTTNVTDMSEMFNGDRNITDLSPLANISLVNVKNMSGMFRYCYGIADLSPLAAWGQKLNKVKNMNGLFMSTAITTLNGLNTWQMNDLENMSGMFSNCSKLTNISDISNWGLPGTGFTSNIKNLSALFSGCSSLVDISALSGWQGVVYNVETTSNMFSGCTNLEDITPLYHWSLTSVEDVSSMFNNCKKATGKIMVRKVITNYSSMFSGAATADGARIEIDYPVNPGGNYTSEQVRDFIWQRIVGTPYQYNPNVSLGMAVYY